MPSKRRAATPWRVSGELFSTAHPGHPGHPYASRAAVSCNHQGRPIFSAGRPGRPGAGWRSPARACLKSSARRRRLPEVVLSIAKSYAWSAEVRMEGDIDHLQISFCGQLYRRTAIKPHRRTDGSVTQLATMESRCPVCGEAFQFESTQAARAEPTLPVTQGIGPEGRVRGVPLSAPAYAGRACARPLPRARNFIRATATQMGQSPAQERRR